MHLQTSSCQEAAESQNSVADQPGLPTLAFSSWFQVAPSFRHGNKATLPLSAERAADTGVQTLWKLLS